MTHQDIITRLETLRKTLDRIEVRGADNLNALLGSIQYVDRLTAELAADAEAEHADD